MPLEYLRFQITAEMMYIQTNLVTFEWSCIDLINLLFFLSPQAIRYFRLQNLAEIVLKSLIWNLLVNAYEIGPYYRYFRILS